MKVLKTPNIIVGIQVFDEYDILTIAPFSKFNELELLTQKIANILGVYSLMLLIDKPFRKWPLNTITDIILNDLSFG